MHKTRQQFTETLRKEQIGAMLAEKRRKVMQGNDIIFTTDNLRDACLELKRVMQFSGCSLEELAKVVRNLQIVSTGAMGKDQLMKESHLDILLDSGAIGYLMDILSPIHEKNTEVMLDALWIVINSFTADDVNNRLHLSGILYSLLILLDATRNLEIADQIVWVFRNAVSNHTDTRDYFVQKDLWGLLRQKTEELYKNDEGGALSPEEDKAYQNMASHIVKLAVSFLKVRPYLSFKAVR